MKILLFSLLSLIFISQASADLTVYSDRPTHLTDPITDAFEAATGNKVIVKSLQHKEIKAAFESGDTAADVIFVKDMIYLNDLSKSNYLQSLDSSTLSQVPSYAQGQAGQYAAVALRVRTIVYDPSFVTPAQLSTYEELASSKWAGQLCLRTSQSSYNQALVSFLVSKHGTEKTTSILQGWVNNLALDPLAKDTQVIDAIANGQCLVGLVNSYYLAEKLAANPSLPVQIFFANQASGGTHMNGLGAGVTKFSKNASIAQQYVAFLLTPQMQNLISNNSSHYPALNGMASPVKSLLDWGSYTASLTAWSSMHDHVSTAKSIMTSVGYK